MALDFARINTRHYLSTLYAASSITHKHSVFVLAIARNNYATRLWRWLWQERKETQEAGRNTLKTFARLVLCRNSSAFWFRFLAIERVLMRWVSNSKDFPDNKNKSSVVGMCVYGGESVAEPESECGRKNPLNAWSLPENSSSSVGPSITEQFSGWGSSCILKCTMYDVMLQPLLWSVMRV